jgi:hypothetical protein
MGGHRRHHSEEEFCEEHGSHEVAQRLIEQSGPEGEDRMRSAKRSFVQRKSIRLLWVVVLVSNVLEAHSQAQGSGAGGGSGSGSGVGGMQPPLVAPTGMQVLPGKEGLGPVNVRQSGVFALPSDAVLASSGFNISLTDPSGLTAQLFVPPGAWPKGLRSAPTITIYDPPQVMSGAVFKGTLAGPIVDFGPAGLSLNGPATILLPFFLSSCSSMNSCQASVSGFLLAQSQWIPATTNPTTDFANGLAGADVNVLATYTAMSSFGPVNTNFNLVWVPPQCAASCITGIIAGVLFGTLICSFSLAAYFQGVPPLPSFDQYRIKREEEEQAVRISLMASVDESRHPTDKSTRPERTASVKNTPARTQSSRSRGGDDAIRVKSPLNPGETLKVTADVVGGVKREETAEHKAVKLKQVLNPSKSAINEDLEGGRGGHEVGGDDDAAAEGSADDYMDGEAFGKVRVRMEIKKADELREAVKSALSVGSMASSMLKSTPDVDVEIGVNGQTVAGKEESMC